MQYPSIELDNISVFGVDTIKRASTLKQFFVNKKSLKPSRISILRDVSFKANPGDKIAIIGENGSGKSSLLKVISGNYPIHYGKRKVLGTIFPLIEMGAGFNNELTGRENIKLSFAIRGRLKDYSKKLENEIIEIAELQDSIDRPLKTYSSGMHARLAFSSAIVHKADIMLLDEILATGDQSFQNKSYALIKEKIEQTAITIIVTHSLDSVVEICNRFILMHKGFLISSGTASQVISQYYSELVNSS